MIWCMLSNIVSIICFTFLAIHFEKWWIVLFAAIFILTYKSENKLNKEEEEGTNERSSSKG